MTRRPLHESDVLVSRWISALLLCLLAVTAGCAPVVQRYGGSTHTEPSTVPQATSSPVAEKVRVRVHSSHVATEHSYVSDNLVIASVGQLAVGYQRLGHGAATGVREVFGVQLPFGPRRSSVQLFEVSGHFLKGENEQREVILAFRPSNRVEVLGRWFDVPDGEGAALMSHLRARADFDAPGNIGAGGFLVGSLQRRVGGYGWARVRRLRGLFLGVGRTIKDTRYVMGFPSIRGKALRYVGVRSGADLRSDEVILSTAGLTLRAVDFYSPLVPIKASDALIATSGVFTYQVPPISARGMGFTMGMKRISGGSVDRFLEGEAVVYAGRVFAGFRLTGRQRGLDTGTVGVPVGYQFNNGDGRTRRFLRVVPSYDLAKSEPFLAVLFEWNFH